MAFNPNDHLISLKGKPYLEVKWRLVWFRMEHPDYGISTQMVQFDPQAKFAIFHAVITDSTGRVVAEGTKMEDSKGFPDYPEKAETGAIGRALGILGYGTQFAPEFDEIDPSSPSPRIVDAPIEPIKPKADAPKPPRPEAMELKALGIEFGNIVIANEGQVTSDRIKEVFRILTNGAERNVTTLSAVLTSIRELTPDAYFALLDSLKENPNA